MARLTKDIEKQIYDILGRDDINISYLSYGDLFENIDPTYSVRDPKLNSLMDFSILTLWPGIVQYTVELPKKSKIKCVVRTDAKKHRPAAQRVLAIRDNIIGKALQNNFSK
ncbi:MAG: hypothetical protein J5613_02565 [Alphaproteobacteria bacterium]|nr:hypothetical protein [Alphaproteobacteria bacterium]MBR4806224.1 hypothetical protein [Alphaproteobacteria bacterium]